MDARRLPRRGEAMRIALPSVGDAFGRLTVTGYAETIKYVRRLLVSCSCGSELIVKIYDLHDGTTKSCGCLQRDAFHSTITKHGHHGTPEYRIWKGIRSRCYTPSSRGYKTYGARGIVMCDRWRSDFMAFLSDMGPRPSDKHSIDRIDGNGNYDPGNCRWATVYTQTRNKKNNVWIELGGRRMCLNDWARETGISRGTIRSRIKRGLPPEQALCRIDGRLP